MPAPRTVTPPGEATQAGRIPDALRAEVGTRIEDGPAVLWDEPPGWAASGIPVMTPGIQDFARASAALLGRSGILVRLEPRTGTAHVRRDDGGGVMMLRAGCWRLASDAAQGAAP